MRVGSASIAFVSVAACVPATDVALTVPEGTQTALIATVVRGVVEIDVVSARGGELSYAITARGGRSATLLFYRRTIEELMLEPGELPRALEGEDGEPLPRASAMVDVLFRSRDEADLSSRTELPDVLQSFRMPRLDRGACFRDGGCFVSTDEGLACVRECPPAAPIASPMPPADPQPPSPPSFLPCPPGWLPGPPIRGVAAGDPDIETCGPPAKVLAGHCPIDQAHFVDTATCAAVGPLCPLGQWPDPLPTAPVVVFVDAAAAGGGNGTQGAPHRSLAAALSAAPPGAAIAVARGTYGESLLFDRDVAVVGACAGGVILDGALVAGSAARVELTQLSLTGGTPVLQIIDGSEVVLRDAIVRDGAGVGISAIGGAILTSTGSVIRDQGSAGIIAESGARVSLVRSVLERNGDIGVRGIGAGTNVVIDRSVVRDMKHDGASGGQGVAARDGVALDVKRSIFSGNRARAIGVRAAVSVSIADVEIANTTPAPDGSGGFGISIAEVSGAKIVRTFVHHNTTIGLVAEKCTGLELTDLLIEDTVAPPNAGALALDFSASSGTAERVRVERTAGSGLQLIAKDGIASNLTASNLTIRTSRSTAAGAVAGIGLQVIGSTLAASRIVVDDSEGYGIVCVGPEQPALGRSALKLDDWMVRDTLQSPGAIESGVALSVHTVRLELRRGRAERATNGSISLLEAAPAVIEDAVLGDVLAAPSSQFGLGIGIQQNTRATISRLRIERARNTAMTIFNMNSEVTVSDLVIRDTLAGLLGALVVAADGEAPIEISRARFEANDGRVLNGRSPMELEDIEVLGTNAGEARDGKDYGLAFGAGRTATLVRARISGVGTAGILAENGRSEVLATDVVIEDVRASSSQGASGVRADAGATLRMSRFSIDGVRDVGVRVMKDGVIELDDGELRASSIGAQLSPDAAIDLLLPRVRIAPDVMTPIVYGP